MTIAETTMSTTRRLAAVLMTAASALAIAGFTALGSVFDYPAVLKDPTAEILTRFRAHQSAVTGWFAVLVVGALLLAPVAVLLGRFAGGRLGPWVRRVGVAAALVQAVGLSRWVFWVPTISADATVPSRRSDAYATFDAVHLWLGNVLGETIGYGLTAVFTVLVVLAITRDVARRWLSDLGLAAAALVATGVFVPVGLDVARLTNFAGYVLWCLWVVALAVVLWRPPRQLVTVKRTEAPGLISAGG
jgi:hypothetical protein